MKRIKRYALALVLSVVLFTALPAFAQITITTATELQNMNLDLAGDYVLGNDIDASSIPNFDPVGDNVTRFTGTFDGQGHTITGLTINRPGEDYVGLFGYAYNTTVQNVHLENTNLTGNDFVGSVAGYVYIVSVEDCSNTGIVTGNDYVGGIVGSDGGFSNCHNAGSVIGYNYVGGIAGNSGYLTGCSNSGNVSGSNFFSGGIAGECGDVQNCFNTGTISGNITVGGIAGSASGVTSKCYNTGTISGVESIGGIVGSFGTEVSNCYSTGSVSGTNVVGGLVGLINTGGIIYCYSIGFVTGTTNVGGLLGLNMSGAVITSYWNTETSGQATSAGGEGKTTAEMIQQTSYLGWDFSTVWGMPCDGSSYPYLLIFPPDPIMAPVNVTINQSASQADPTDIALINFDVVFDVPVTDFDNGDVDFTGSTALIADAVVTDTGDGMHYTVAVTSSTEGTVVASIPAGVLDLCGVATNTASSSTDNTVEYMAVLPTVPLTAWPLAVVLFAAGIGFLRQRRRGILPR